MATSSVTKRVIRLPASQAPAVRAVVTDILNKCRSLAASPIVQHISGDSNTLILEFNINSTNDTTLQSFMASWATRLGLPLLDTEAFAATAGHP